MNFAPLFPILLFIMYSIFKCFDFFQNIYYHWHFFITDIFTTQKNNLFYDNKISDEGNKCISDAIINYKTLETMWLCLAWMEIRKLSNEMQKNDVVIVSEKEFSSAFRFSLLFPNPSHTEPCSDFVSNIIIHKDMGKFFI